MGEEHRTNRHIQTLAGAPESDAWKEKLTRVQFNNPLLQEFPSLMQNFLENEGQEIQDELKEVIELTENHYKNEPEQLNELYKYLTLGCVFTQNRYKQDDQGLEIKQTSRRKFEKKPIKRFNEITQQDEIVEVNPPSFIHALRAYKKSLESRAHASVSKAAPIHDIYEDGRMIINGEEVSGNKILDIIRDEFKESDGKDVALLVESVSKYEKIPAEIEKTIKKHFFYRAIVNHVQLHLHRNGIAAEKIVDYEESILKAISSIIKLQLTLLENTKDEDEYLHMLSRAFLLKCIDINDNLASPGTRPPILLRDRMFATIARLMNSPLADEMMSNMALQEDDPLFAGRNLREVVEKLTPDEKERYKQDCLQFMQDTFGVTVPPHNIRTGLRIPFRDEGELTPAPQLMIRCTKEEIESIRHEIHSRKNFSVLSKLTTKTEEELVTLLQYNGVIENIVNILGRDGIMLKVQNEGKTKLYLRIIEDKPDFVEYAQRKHPKNRKSPEAKLFSRVFVDPTNRISIVNSLMNSRAGLTFDPASLLLEPDTVIFVSDRGVLSCRRSSFDSDQEMIKKGCERLKVGKKNCDALHILEPHKSANLDNPEELHIYMLKEYGV